jgi:hypothetical protein
MSCRLTVLALTCLAGIPACAQTSRLTKADQSVIVKFAQQAAVRALDFHEGDSESLTRARADFTPQGWREFLKHMEGWLDQKGAPTFTSSFVPSGNAVIVDEENGVVHLRIQGRLKQSQKNSSTTYRAAIDIQAGGRPVKLRHLEQITCAGTSHPSPCDP